MSEIGAIDWSIINEALFDDEPVGVATEINSSSSAAQTDQSKLQPPVNKSSDEKESKLSRASTKRKRETLQEHIKTLEEQNKLMRLSLAEYNMSPADLINKQNARLDVFKKLIDVFNNGDIERLTSYIMSTSSADCLLLTPSLFQELHGRNAAVQFWTLILESFPDGIFQLSETTVEDNGFVASRFCFTGTKVAPLPSDVLLHRWGSFRETILKSDPGAAPSTSSSTTSEHSSGTSEAKTSAGSQQGSGTNTDSSNTASTSAGVINHCPTVNLTGYMTVTFNSSEKINRYIFVWNTASLIGQILGLSNGDLETMSRFFHPVSGPVPSRSGSN
mmetsp:Transcript_24849/g.36653  ORF Transcript_24849/g.36653 Transcript_24849/m.36653 type:complete len:332 (+) Transcript_24849:216-1211(+)|eukprot:CAMPEP_0185028644 /NCGR_PEP_ID=MMETSP1103-20130426/14497_1 /TAXON_ID=36769 /ORGANISM="Paraphysomonas bandaiensis, Strain Caron Lab Isolate" /LENGTH=331 /DNA_ID=CAMNT_0027563121 /DNA_START=168 /DNA_END=1163 /DNA_ORIENTATION=+